MSGLEFQEGDVLTPTRLNRKTLYIGSTALQSPLEGQMWLDTSQTPHYMLKIRRGGRWQIAGVLVDRVIIPTEPSEYSTPIAALSSEGGLYNFKVGVDGWQQISGSVGWDGEHEAINIDYTTENGIAENTDYSDVYAIEAKIDQYYVNTRYATAEIYVDNDNWVHIQVRQGTQTVAVRSDVNGSVVEHVAGDYLPTSFQANGRVFIKISGGDTVIAKVDCDGDGAWDWEQTYTRSNLPTANRRARLRTDGDCSFRADDVVLNEHNTGRCIDDTLSTYYENTSPTPSIKWDLGATRIVSGFRIYWDADAAWRPTDYNLYGSGDGSSWSELVHETTDPGEGWREYSFNAKYIRYIKLAVNTSGSSGVRIYEADYYSTLVEKALVRHGHGGYYE